LLACFGEKGFEEFIYHECFMDGGNIKFNKYITLRIIIEFMMDGLTDSGAKKPSIVQSAEVIKVTSNDGKSFYVNKDVLCISKRF